MLLIVLCYLQAPSPNLSTLSIEDEDVVKETVLSNRDQTEWPEQKLSLRELPQIYLKLSKYRLTGNALYMRHGFMNCHNELQVALPMAFLNRVVYLPIA